MPHPVRDTNILSGTVRIGGNPRVKNHHAPRIGSRKNKKHEKLSCRVTYPHIDEVSSHAAQPLVSCNPPIRRTLVSFNSPTLRTSTGQQGRSSGGKAEFRKRRKTKRQWREGVRGGEGGRNPPNHSVIPSGNIYLPLFPRTRPWPTDVPKHSKRKCMEPFLRGIENMTGRR